MPKRPDPNDVPTLNDYESAGLYYRRLIDLVAEGDLSKSTVALEVFVTLVAMYDAEGKDPQKFIDALQVKSFREHTVPVPVELLKVLAEPWQDYRKENGALSFSQKLGIDGKGQGKGNTAKRLNKLNRDVGLCNCVHLEIISDTDLSVESAISLVAENKEVSEDTVKQAYQKNKRWLLEYLEQING